MYQSPQFLFLFFWFLHIGIRVYFILQKKEGARFNFFKFSWLEIFTICLAIIGMFLLPVLQMTLHYFDWANYSQPFYFIYLSVFFFMAALHYIFHSQRLLGEHWSPSLELVQGHKIISKGVYKNIRHPMYLALFLWSVAQVFTLPNLVTGFSGIVGFSLLYFFRIDYEEAMLLEKFGSKYADYIKKTGRLLPLFYKIK